MHQPDSWRKNQENSLLPNRFSKVKSYILLRLAKYRDVYLTSEKEDIREELREEIRSLKDEIRHQVSQALESSGSGSIRVDLHKDDVAQAEPSFVVVKDLVRQIRENVKSSLATRGEIAVDELVENMPETTAADLLKSLANTDRLKMVKMLYSTRKTFSDFKTVTGLEAASVNNHLKSLLNMGLVSHSDEGGYELTKRGRLLVR